MVFINLHGWDYIISDKKYEEISITLLSSRGVIWNYVYLDYQKKGDNNPIQYNINTDAWKNIKEELQKEYKENFKEIETVISDNKMKSKLIRSREKFGTYWFYFNDLERDDIIKLKELNVKLMKKMDISIYFNYVRRN